MEWDLAGWMFLTLPRPGPNKQSALGQEKQIPVGTTNKLLDWTALSNHSPTPWAFPGTCLQHQIPRHQGGLEPCAQYSVPEDARAQGRNQERTGTRAPGTPTGSAPMIEDGLSSY